MNKNLNILRMERAFEMKQKAFFINFQGLSVAKNCLRLETAPLTTLAIKSGLLYNFTKILKGHHFMGHSGTVFQFSLVVICKSLKL